MNSKTSTLALMLGLGLPGLAQAQTYVSPDSRHIGASGDVAVYRDTTDGVEVTCTTGTAACQSTQFVQLDSGYNDSVVFVRGYQLLWDAPGAAPDELENMGFDVAITYDKPTGQAAWTAEANFKGDVNTDINYILEVTIILANKTSTKVMEFDEVSTRCTALTDDPPGTCTDNALLFVPSGMTAIAAPVRALSLSAGTNPIRVERMGFDSTSLTPVFGGAATQVDTTCDLIDGGGASHSFTCDLDSVLIFADTSILNTFGQVSQSDSGINWMRAWTFSKPDPGLGAVFTGLTAHVQQPDPAVPGSEFLVTRGECFGGFNGTNIDYLERTLLGETFPTGWNFDASISCMRVEVN